MLEPAIRDLAQGGNFATIAVHLADGRIASHVMWVDADDEHVLINTEVHRTKYQAAQRDPNVTVTIWDRDDPYRYAEVRGRVAGEARGDEARAHIDTLSERYEGHEYRNEIESERVILRIEPLRQRSRAVTAGDPLVGVVMGSTSDWPTMEAAVAVLDRFGVAHEAKVVSAHRTPDEMFAYAEAAAGRGLRAIIAGAGGAAHLPGMLAAKTTIPVLGVPVPSRHLGGQDSLYSIVQMPAGVPVATFAIGQAGATNAALFAVALLALDDVGLATALTAYRAERHADAAGAVLPPPST